MWLINTATLELENHQKCPDNSYAILSHTWGSEADELTFDEFRAARGRQKPGFSKIRSCCEQAQKDGLLYAWVDTCCIDKRSSAELSEAINSMFDWYARSKICYAHLVDVEDDDTLTEGGFRRDLDGCRWFARGWTLQELIAPKIVKFYDGNWKCIGDKSDLATVLQTITGIDSDVLTSTKSFRVCSVAQRMSWASKRQTTRVEDSAYSLMGLFDVSMPLLYGEGSKAFLRLQEMIIQETDDESIFAWTGVDDKGSGLFALSPANFSDAASVQQSERQHEYASFTKTNQGVRVECHLLPYEINIYLVPLQCWKKCDTANAVQLAIFLCRTNRDHQYRRIQYKAASIAEAAGWEIANGKFSTIFVPTNADTLKLAQHGGLPVVHIKSDLCVWQFTEVENENARQDEQAVPISPQHVSLNQPGSSNHSNGQCATQNTDIVEGNLEIDSTGCDFTYRFGSRTVSWRRINDEDVGLPCPKFGQSAVFVLQMKGAPSRSQLYVLEIGFDVDFRPVCTLQVRSFSLPISLSSHRFAGLRKKLGLSSVSLRVHKNRKPPLRVYNVCGPDRKCACNGEQMESGSMQPTQLCHVCERNFRHRWKEESRRQSYCAYGTRVRDSALSAVPTEDLDSWTIRGHIFEGFEAPTTESLLARHGTINVKLSLRPREGSNWLLEIENGFPHPNFDPYIPRKFYPMVRWLVLLSLLTLPFEFGALAIGRNWISPMLGISKLQGELLAQLILLPPLLLDHLWMFLTLFN